MFIPFPPYSKLFWTSRLETRESASCEEAQRFWVFSLKKQTKEISIVVAEKKSF